MQNFIKSLCNSSIEISGWYENYPWECIFSNIDIASIEIQATISVVMLEFRKNTLAQQLKVKINYKEYNFIHIWHNFKDLLMNAIIPNVLETRSLHIHNLHKGNIESWFRIIAVIMNMHSRIRLNNIPWHNSHLACPCIHRDCHRECCLNKR